MIKRTTVALLAAGLLALTACGGKSGETPGDNVEQACDNQADQLDAKADNLEQQAEALRDEGDRKEEAIDAANADVAGQNAADRTGAANSL